MVFLLVLTAYVSAQSSATGAIIGTVFDQSKALVANAKVTATNQDTSEQSATITDAGGRFRQLLLTPGTYQLTVEANGFGARKLQVVVEVGRVTDLEIALSLASARETVEVTSEAPAVNTVQSDFSHNISQASIDNLPINGRRWSNFALLTPGASLDGNFGLISFRGVSGLLNNSTVDGGDNNQAFFSEERGRTRASYVISQSSVREFQVNTSNFSAEYGRAAGAVVNSVTKSGTNQVHGQVFYYIRDNEFGATNPFSLLTAQNARGTWMSTPVKPDDRRQQFGASIGGPIVHDKLFYFFTYDQQKRNYPGLAAVGKPSFFDTPTSSELTTLKKVMPSGTSTAQATGAWTQAMQYVAGFTGEVPRRADQIILFPKLDWKITPNHSAAISYNRMRWDSPAGAESRPVYNRGVASWGNDYVKVDSLIARLTSALAPKVSNEMRFQYSRDIETQYAQPAASGEPTTGPFGNAPQISIASSSNGMSLGMPSYLNRAAYPDENRLQFANSTSIAIRKHLVKAGFDLNRVDDRMNSLYQGGGAFSYTSRSGFAADYIAWLNAGTPGYSNTYKGYSTYTQAFGRPEFDFTTLDSAYFAQDDWRILPTLTLSFGLRYEMQSLPNPQIANANVPLTQSFAADRNNFGPRFGFAWDVFGDGNTSLRGGYGIYYGRISNSTISSALTNTGVAQAQRTYVWRYNTTGGPVFPATFNSAKADPISDPASAVRPDISVFSPNMQNPQIHQADLVLERQVAPNTMISASYLLSLGRQLPNFVDTNLDPASIVSADDPKNIGYTFSGGPYDGSTLLIPYYTSRANPAFGRITQIKSNVNSVYNALVLKIDRRMTRGLQYQLSYTWSHAIDNGQNSTTFTTGNNTIFPSALTYILDGKRNTLTNPDRGTSNFDVRQRLVGSFVWAPQTFKRSGRLAKAILDDWAISPIFAVSTGRPYSEYIGGTPAAVPATCNGCTGLFGTGGVYRLPFVARNSWRFPNLQNVDLRLAKRIRVREGQRVELVAEAFNVLNHVNVTDNANQMYYLSGGSFVYDSTFGEPTAAGNTIYRERQVQFALKYYF